jgi:hypothetical protein
MSEEKIVQANRLLEVGSKILNTEMFAATRQVMLKL